MTDIEREIEHYNNLPCVFEDFVDLPQLFDGVISLNCTAKHPAVPEKNWVPSYMFDICLDGEKVGQINLRIGYSERLYYGGQIGYDVDEAHRGKGFAGRACRLIAQVAKVHGMTKLLITNNQTNAASMRVCEKLGARLLRIAAVPKWHDLYERGQLFSNIYEWEI